MLSKAASLALTFIIFFAPFALGTVHLWAETVLGLAIIVFFFLCAAMIIEEGVVSRGASVVSLSFIAIFLFACLQIYFKITEYPYRTYRAGELGLIYFALFTATYYFLRERRDVESIFFKITLAGFAVSVLGIVQFLTGTDKVYWLFGFSGALPFGPFIYENHFACYASMTALATIGGIMLSSTKGEAVNWEGPLKISIVKFFNNMLNGKIFFRIFAIIVIISAVFLSKSRAGIILLLMSIAFFSLCMLLTRHKEKIAWVLIIALLAIVLLITWVGVERTVKELQTIFSYKEYVGRAELYFDALKMIKSHPFTGVGIDAFAAAFPAYRSRPEFNFYEYLHSDVLQLSVDAGVIGFFLIIAPFVVFLRQLGLASGKLSDRSLRYTALALFSACFYIILHSSIDFCMRTGAISSLFVIVLALGAAVMRTGGKTADSSAGMIRINIPGNNKKAAYAVFFIIFIFAWAIFTRPLLAAVIAGRAQNLKDLDRAISIDPGNDELFLNRYKMAADLYKDKKITEYLAYKEARFSLEKALELNKCKTKYLLLLAGLESRRGNYLEAEALLGKAMDQEPNNQTVRMAYAYELFLRAIKEKDMATREKLLRKGFVYYSMVWGKGVILKHVAPDDASYSFVKGSLKKMGLNVQ